MSGLAPDSAAIRRRLGGTPVRGRTSAIGAALLAGKAAGLISDIRMAVLDLNPVADVALPLAQHREAYDNAYRRYRQVFASLRPLF